MTSTGLAARATSHLGGLGLVTLGLVAAVVLASERYVDTDLWWHLAEGRETVARGWPPSIDPFAYVPTRVPQIQHEWLSGVLFYLLATKVSAVSLKVLLVALGLTTLALAGLTSRRLGATPVATGAVALVALPSLGLNNGLIRPQAFTFCLFALVLLLLVAGDRGSLRWLLPVPLIVGVWANLHGGFLAGIGVVALFLGARMATGPPPWRLLLVLVLATLASLANPYGPALWGYLWRSITMPRPSILEWQPLHQDLATHWMSLALLVVAALSVALARRPFLPGLLVLAATGLLALRHTKHASLFAVAAIAFVPAHLTPLAERVTQPVRSRLGRSRGLSRATVAVLAVLALVLGLNLAVAIPWEPQVSAADLPVGAVEFLRVNALRGNLATSFNWGQYVLWKAGPAVKVSFDARYEVAYPDSVAAANFDFERGRGDWRRLLRDYPTEMVLVPRSYPVAALMAREPGWSAVYEDAVSVLFLPGERSRRAGPWKAPVMTRATLVD